MERSCETCIYDLGGGRDNCTENVAYECRDGGGFEHWTPKDGQTDEQAHRRESHLMNEIRALERIIDQMQELVERMSTR